jgi:hypothetical protein
VNGAKALLELAALISELEKQRTRADAAEHDAAGLRFDVKCLRERLPTEDEKTALGVLAEVKITHCCGVPMISDAREADLCRAELARREKAGAK